MFTLEPVAFDFNGEILSFNAYNDKLAFLMQLETGYKILRVNLKNPEVIEDFNVKIDDQYCMKMLSNIILLTEHKLYLVDLNIEYDLEFQMCDIVEYKEGYISVSQRGHIYYLQGTTVIDSGLMNKLRNKSKTILKSVEIGSLPNEKGIHKMIIQPFPTNVNIVGFLFIQNRVLYQAIWQNDDFNLNELCRDVIDISIYKPSIISPITRMCIATSRSIYLASTNYSTSTADWVKLQDPIALNVVKISHCFLTEYYVGIVDDISKSISFYWIPDASNVDLLSTTKITDFKGFCHDPLQNTYWVYTNRQLFEVVAVNETKGLWRKFVQIHEFQKATELATTIEDKDEILYNQGKYLLEQHHGLEAANCFSKMGRFDLDEITLLFMHFKDNALKDFLLRSIPRIPNKVSKVLVLHWALHLGLEELNISKLKKIKFSNAFCKSLLSDHKYLLHSKSVYQLLSSHDESELLLHFATLISDFDFLIKFHIYKQDFKLALETLQYQNDAQLIYNNISLLLQRVPKETIQLLLNHPKIAPTMVIPAFVKHLSLQNGDLDAILQYLESIIKTNKEQSVHNFLISLYCQYCNENDKIMPYLLGNRRFCDVDYALRQTEKFNHHLSTLTLFSELELHDEAVQLALRLDDLELSKLAMSKVSDSTEQHRLWLKIAKYVVEKHGNLSAVMALLKESPLDIQDIIQWFPDFDEISEFKQEICNSLDKHQKAILQVKSNIEKWQNISQGLQREKIELRKRYVAITRQEKCLLCKLGLIQNGDYFTIYSCKHGFHFNCMLDYVSEILPSRQEQELKNLREMMEKADSEELLFKIRQEIEELATFECCYCGELMIRSIDMPFYAPNENPLKMPIGNR